MLIDARENSETLKKRFGESCTATVVVIGPGAVQFNQLSCNSELPLTCKYGVNIIFKCSFFYLANTCCSDSVTVVNPILLFGNNYLCLFDDVSGRETQVYLTTKSSYISQFVTFPSNF